MQARLLAILFIVLAASLDAGASALDNWQWRNPAPEGNTFSSVASGSAGFVAVGAAGTIATSPDAVHWAAVNAGSADYYGVACLSGSYFALGDAGTIATSTDTVNWTNQYSGTTATLYAIAQGDGAFIAVGASGVIRYSVDGTHWVAATSGTTVNLYGITCFGGIFVAVGDNGTILTSSNGYTWSSESLTGIEAESSFYAVASGSGTFVAAGGSGILYTSTDGYSWSEPDVAIAGNDIHAATFGGGMFVAIDDAGNIETSPDGNSWISNGALGGSVAGVAYGAGIFAAVGSGGDSDGDIYGAIWSSPNATAWTAENTATAYGNIDTVAYGNGGFVAAGDNGLLLTSTNGAAWSTGTAGTTSDLYSVAFGNGAFVAVGNEVILTSSNRVKWTAANLEYPNLFQGVAFGSGTFVAVGQSGTIETSPDGLNWSDQNPGAFDDFNAVAYGNGYFVAVGVAYGFPPGTQTAASVSSTDGVNWTPGNLTSTSELLGVTFADGFFAAVGANGTILTSYDGITWYEGVSPTSSDLTSITTDGQNFAAAGANGALVTSTNGGTWVLAAPAAAGQQQLNGIAYGYGTFVAVGSNGSILQSQTLPGIGPGVTTGSAAQITMTGALLSGTVNPEGAATSAVLAYSASPSMAGALLVGSKNIAPGSSGVALSASLSALTPGQTYYFQARASNAAAMQTGAIVPFTTIPFRPAITSGTVADGVPGELFTYQITATNHPASYLVKNLPAGLNWSGSTGLISGTMNTSGAYSATISAINLGGTGSATLDLYFEPVPVIGGALSATGTSGYFFDYPIQASNGAIAFTGRGLPEGLTCDQTTGVISGTPTETGTFDAAITASNIAQTGSATLVLVIDEATMPVITSPSSASGVNGAAFQYQIKANIVPYSFGASGLPPGLSVDSTNGLISGVPEMGGVFPVTLAASSPGGTGTAGLLLTVTTTIDTLNGSYVGLGALDGVNDGLFTLTMNKTGVFSARLALATASYPMSGKFSSYGNAAGQVRSGRTTINFALNLDAAIPGLSGTVTASTASGTSACVVEGGLLGSFNSRSLPPGIQGRYTVVIPAVTGTVPAIPSAPGYGTMTVGSTGALGISGKLGDGAPFAVSGRLQADRMTCTIFKALYGGRIPGTLAGNIYFQSSSQSDWDGVFDWIKPPRPGTAYYPAGFRLGVNFFAARYFAPALGTGTAALIISNPELSGSTTTTDMLTIEPNGRVLSSGSAAVALTPSTGAFTGRFPNPVTKRNASFGGVIYQKPSPAGYGLFLGAHRSGEVGISQ